MPTVSEPTRKHRKAARDIKAQMARPYDGKFHLRRARIKTHLSSIERRGKETPVVLVDAANRVEKDTLKAALGDRFAGRNYTETPGQRKRTIVYLSL